MNLAKSQGPALLRFPLARTPWARSRLYLDCRLRWRRPQALRGPRARPLQHHKRTALARSTLEGRGGTARLDAPPPPRPTRRAALHSCPAPHWPASLRRGRSCCSHCSSPHSRLSPYERLRQRRLAVPLSPSRGHPAGPHHGWRRAASAATLPTLACPNGTTPLRRWPVALRSAPPAPLLQRPRSCSTYSCRAPLLRSLAVCVPWSRPGPGPARPASVSWPLLWIASRPQQPPRMSIATGAPAAWPLRPRAGGSSPF